MSRTPKPSGSKKEARSVSAYSRKTESIDPVDSIIIACEDSESSRTYFQIMINELIEKRVLTRSSAVLAPHRCTDPKGVLSDLQSYSNKAGIGYKDFGHKWIVIDRDKQLTIGAGHGEENFNEALKSAREDGVKVAYSNDAFELWYILHFEYYQAEVTRSDLKKKLMSFEQISTIAKGNIKSANFAKAVYPILADKKCDAIKNAEKLRKYHLSAGTEPCDANPSTTIHLLVCLLTQIGEKSDEIICDCNK